MVNQIKIKMPSGGPRPNSGRKPVAIENHTKELCRAAISGKYGSLEDGLKWLLDSEEPALIKFVYEHAFGKPTEKIEGELKITQLTFKDAE